MDGDPVKINEILFSEEDVDRLVYILLRRQLGGTSPLTEVTYEFRYALRLLRWPPIPLIRPLRQRWNVLVDCVYRGSTLQYNGDSSGRLVSMEGFISDKIIDFIAQVRAYVAGDLKGYLVADILSQDISDREYS